jgi:DNA-directed RNA polymerase specialized sigma24 family protein
MEENREEELALAQVAILQMLLEEMADEQGPDYAQRVLLGEAAPPPQELLHELADTRRDLALVRQNQHLARLLGYVEAVQAQMGNVPAEVEERIRRVIAEHAAPAATSASKNEREVLTVHEAAAVLGVTVKTLQNRISEARRSGRELPWVLRAGRKRGCSVHRERFYEWLEQKPVRRGRPPGS